MTRNSYDVVVIGAGIIGLSIAYQIARRSKLKIVLLERAAAIGEGSTGASSAVLRHLYTFSEMVRLARDGINAYRQWPEYIGIAEPEATMQQTGVLWLTEHDSSLASNGRSRLQEFGIAAEILDDKDIKARFPSLNPCPIAPDMEQDSPHDCVSGGQHLFEISGGYIDPMACAHDLLLACRREGVEVRYRAEVSGIQVSAGRVSGILLNDGTAIAAPLVVNATGPWCNRILSELDIAWPWQLTPTRIQIAYVDMPATINPALPVCGDMVGGIYFRPQNRGQQLVLGSTLAEDENEIVANPDHFDRFADAQFTAAKLHVLHHRLPAWSYRGKVKGYCGLYTINRDDFHPLVGTTDLPGFIVANGFSGHGFKLAPAVASLVAQLVTGERAAFDTDVAPSFLSPARQPLRLEKLSVLA